MCIGCLRPGAEGCCPSAFSPLAESVFASCRVAFGGVPAFGSASRGLEEGGGKGEDGGRDGSRAVCSKGCSVSPFSWRKHVPTSPPLHPFLPTLLLARGFHQFSSQWLELGRSSISHSQQPLYTGRVVSLLPANWAPRCHGSCPPPNLGLLMRPCKVLRMQKVKQMVATPMSEHSCVLPEQKAQAERTAGFSNHFSGLSDE